MKAEFKSLRKLPLWVALHALCFVGYQALAAGNATVEITTKSTGKNLEITFKTVPKTGLVINHDGPWKLEIKDQGGLKFEKSEYKRADWQDAVSGFTTIAEPTNEKSSKITYKMVAFVCTKDKSQCYRDVIEETQSIQWK